MEPPHARGHERQTAGLARAAGYAGAERTVAVPVARACVFGRWLARAVAHSVRAGWWPCVTFGCAGRAGVVPSRCATELCRGPWGGTTGLP